MSEQTQTASAVNATPTAQELLAQIDLHLQTFASNARRPLEIVMTAYSAYVLSPVPIPLPNALKQLSVIRKWTPDIISAALEEVMGAIAAEMEAIALEFEQTTATEVDETNFKAFEERFEAERTEQLDLIERAKQLIQLVGELSALFGVTNPDPGLHVTEEEVSAQPTATGLGRFGLSWGLLVTTEKPQLVEEAAPQVDWITEPVLDMGNDDVLLIQTIQEQRQFLTDPTQLLAWLTNLGTGKEQLQVVMGRVAQMARNQITQSQQILERARQDYGTIQTRLGVLQDVRAVVLATHDYFFPVETKQAKKG